MYAITHILAIIVWGPTWSTSGIQCNLASSQWFSHFQFLLSPPETFVRFLWFIFLCALFGRINGAATTDDMLAHNWNLITGSSCSAKARYLLNLMPAIAEKKTCKFLIVLLQIFIFYKCAAHFFKAHEFIHLSTHTNIHFNQFSLMRVIP